MGSDISPLTVLVEPVDANILHVKIGAPGRWEVPQKDIFINTGIGERASQQAQTYIHHPSCFLDAL